MVREPIVMLAPTQHEAMMALEDRRAIIRAELGTLERRMDRKPGKSLPNRDHYWIVEWLSRGQWCRWSVHDTLKQARATMKKDSWILTSGSRVRKFVVA